MLYLVLGILGFVLMLGFDLASLKKLITLKYVLLTVSMSLIAYSGYKLAFYDFHFTVYNVFRYVSLPLSLVFFGLLIFSVFIEVGVNTYQKVAEPRLITKGTYSMVRHPGVVWLFFTIFFASMYFTSVYLLVAAFVWTIVNTFYTLVQEKMIFTKIFKDYTMYQQTTPMVIPNVTSIKKFLNTESWRKE
jgi:protein-S-isoprenylcysteine O-methyltransferase Ste14